MEGSRGCQVVISNTIKRTGVQCSIIHAVQHRGGETSHLGMTPRARLRCLCALRTLRLSRSCSPWPGGNRRKEEEEMDERRRGKKEGRRRRGEEV
jgi:hypothetical protein